MKKFIVILLLSNWLYAMDPEDVTNLIPNMIFPFQDHLAILRSKKIQNQDPTMIQAKKREIYVKAAFCLADLIHREHNKKISKKKKAGWLTKEIDLEEATYLTFEALDPYFEDI